jgi:hypothetical protein
VEWADNERQGWAAKTERLKEDCRELWWEGNLLTYDDKERAGDVRLSRQPEREQSESQRDRTDSRWVELDGGKLTSVMARNPRLGRRLFFG